MKQYEVIYKLKNDNGTRWISATFNRGCRTEEDARNVMNKLRHKNELDIKIKVREVSEWETIYKQ